MKLNKALMTACLATTALVGAASLAKAEPFDIVSSGKWTSVTPPGVTGLSGLNTNEIRWGTPANPANLQSGYRFLGNNLSGLSEAQLIDPLGFNLGTFTHFNFTLDQNPQPASITGARLEVAVQFTDTGPSPGVLNRSFTFDFTHNETPNDANPCPDPDGMAPFPGTPCPDIVGFGTGFSQETVDIGGTTYVLQIVGFRVGDNIVSNFLTTEAAQNDAVLVGRLSVPPPRAPEPAGIGLLGLGLAALGAYRLRRRGTA